MAETLYEPLELVPASLVPPSEVFKARVHGDYYSDIFPLQKPWEDEVVFHTTKMWDPQPGSPLEPVTEGIKAYRSRIYGRESMEGLRSDDISSRLLGTLLQTELVRYINKGYYGLLSRRGGGQTPSEAVATINEHIHAHDLEASIGHNDHLDMVIAKQAEYERQNPITEEERALGIYRGHPDIAKLRKRIQRLEFEWLSATAITRLLQLTIEGEEPVKQRVPSASVRK